MKQILQYKYVFILLIMGTCACKKVITVNLNDADPATVIVGNVTNDGTYPVVTINKSVSFYTDTGYPAVHGAIVKITDDSTGITYLLPEDTIANNGTYLSTVAFGAQGHTYQLDIKVGTTEYIATSTMPQQVMLDSITFFTNSGFGQTVTNPLPNFQDPPGVYNAYRFVEAINRLIRKQIFVFDDRLSDGKYISRQLFNDSAYIQSGDTIQLEMQCIDKNIYSYYNELSGQDGTSGQPTSPANPTSNINNGALGYFSAHTVQRKSAVFTK